MKNMDHKTILDQDLQSSKMDSSKPANSIGLLAQVTTLAWNLVIPIVGGVMLGYYLDNRSGDGFTWTLSLLVLGVLIAFSNLYNLYDEQGRQQITNENNKKAGEDSDEKEA